MKPVNSIEERTLLWQKRRLKELAAEQAFIEKQSQKIRVIAGISSLLMFLVFLDGMLPTRSSTHSISTVSRAISNPNLMKIETGGGNVKFNPKFKAIPNVGDNIELSRTPILNQIITATTAREIYHPEFQMSHFWPSHFIGFLLLLFTFIRSKKQKTYWFHSWVLGIVAVVISAISYVISV